MASVLPLDASCEDLSEDLDEGSELHFLDGFVAVAVADGAAPYNPPQNEEDDAGHNDSAAGTIKFEAYETPAKGAIAGSGAITGIIGVGNGAGEPGMGAKSIGGSVGGSQLPGGAGATRGR